MIEKLDTLGKHFITGSSVVCNPPVTDTDIDYVFVFSPQANDQILSVGGIPSYEAEGKRYNNSSVRQAYRLGNINLIAVANDSDYECWYHATRIATKLNLKEKSQRVILFQLLTEGRIRDTDIELVKCFQTKIMDTHTISFEEGTL